MADLSWQEAFDVVKPHVVKIVTPQGSGTGFLIAHAKSKNLCGVATAAHVVSHAHYWEELFRIEHYQSKQSLIVRPAERAILIDEEKDTAAIVFNKGNIPFSDTVLNLIPKGKFVRVGVELGWLGFPVIAPSDLCFFTGRTSCWASAHRSYLIDGVAINGVSGGPTFVVEKAGVLVIGVVSAYIPSQTMAGTLPGLCVVRDVSQFQNLIPTFENLDEAKEGEVPSSQGPPQTTQEPEKDQQTPNKTL